MPLAFTVSRTQHNNIQDTATEQYLTKNSLIKKRLKKKFRKKILQSEASFIAF